MSLKTMTKQKERPRYGGAASVCLTLERLDGKHWLVQASIRHAFYQQIYNFRP